MKERVLFVCLGNICRSPMAEAIFTQMVEHAGLTDRIEIDSAGTYGGHSGELPDRRMRRAGEARGYQLTHRSRQVRADDLEQFDRIIAMDASNEANLRRIARTIDQADKIIPMARYFSHPQYDHVPDPYYEGAEGFKLVIDLLEEGCRTLLNQINNSIVK